MGIVENALIDFVVNHFEEEFENVQELKDELRDLQSNVKDLEEKVDRLLEDGQGVQQTSDTSSSRGTSQKRVSSGTLTSMRDRFDLTQQELADLLEVSSGSITSWETGKSRPSKNNKEKIVSLREKSKDEIEDLLDRDEDASEAPSTDVRSIRKEHGLTQKEFAEQLGVSVTTVYNWEKGETQPGAEKLEQIENLEDVDTSSDGGSGSADFSGEDIQELRKEKDLTQSELAEEIGVSSGTVSNWERGESSPGASAVEKLQNL